MNCSGLQSETFCKSFHLAFTKLSPKGYENHEEKAGKADMQTCEGETSVKAW